MSRVARFTVEQHKHFSGTTGFVLTNGMEVFPESFIKEIDPPDSNYKCQLLDLLEDKKCCVEETLKIFNTIDLLSINRVCGYNVDKYIEQRKNYLEALNN